VACSVDSGNPGTLESGNPEGFIRPIGNPQGAGDAAANMPEASSILAIAIGLGIGLSIGGILKYLRANARLSGRPVGVTLIAVFQFGTGTLLLLVCLLVGYEAIKDFKELEAGLKRVGAHPQTFFAEVMATSLTLLLGGWGLWRGTSWGWRFALFAVACGVVRNLLALGFDGGALERQGAAAYFVQHLARAGFNVFLMTYLYRDRVLDHFHLSVERLSHLRSLLVTVALSLALDVSLRMLTR
jgi:hypothetical protein